MEAGAESQAVAHGHPSAPWQSASSARLSWEGTGVVLVSWEQAGNYQVSHLISRQFFPSDQGGEKVIF